MTITLSVGQSAAQARAGDRHTRHHDGGRHAAAEPRRPQHLAQLQAPLPRLLRVHEQDATARAAVRYCAARLQQRDQGAQSGAGCLQPLLPRHVYQ